MALYNHDYIKSGKSIVLFLQIFITCDYDRPASLTLRKPDSSTIAIPTACIKVIRSFSIMVMKTSDKIGTRSAQFDERPVGIIRTHRINFHENNTPFTVYGEGGVVNTTQATKLPLERNNRMVT
jgi:hypothetical protein